MNPCCTDVLMDIYHFLPRGKALDQRAQIFHLIPAQAKRELIYQEFYPALLDDRPKARYRVLKRAMANSKMPDDFLFYILEKIDPAADQYAPIRAAALTKRTAILDDQLKKLNGKIPNGLLDKALERADSWAIRRKERKNENKLRLAAKKSDTKEIKKITQNKNIETQRIYASSGYGYQSLLDHVSKDKSFNPNPEMSYKAVSHALLNYGQTAARMMLDNPKTNLGCYDYERLAKLAKEYGHYELAEKIKRAR